MFRGGPSYKSKWTAWLEWLMWFIGPQGYIGRGDNYCGSHKVCDRTTPQSTSPKWRFIMKQMVRSRRPIFWRPVTTPGKTWLSTCSLTLTWLFNLIGMNFAVSHLLGYGGNMWMEILSCAHSVSTVGLSGMSFLTCSQTFTAQDSNRVHSRGGQSEIHCSRQRE